MSKILKRCKDVLYADDILIYTGAKNDRECQHNMKYDVRKMNKLNLNKNKTKIMEMNMNSDEVFKINDSVIENVEHIKYLSFVIDKKLNLNEHVDYT